MAYLAAVQAYGSDSSTSESSSSTAAQDPATPALVQLFGFASETTRNWLTGLEVSPRGATAAAKINGTDCVSDTITITDASGSHELEFTAGLLTGYTFTAAP